MTAGRTIAVTAAPACAALLLWAAAAQAQTLTISGLAREREKAAASRSLPESEKQQILGFYDEALKSLQAALRHQAAALGQKRRAQALQQELDSWEKAASETLPAAPPAPPQTESLPAVEDALAQAQTEKRVRQRALSDLQRVMANLTKRHEEIGNRRAELQAGIEEAGDELAVVQINPVSPAWEAAQRLRIEAKKQAPRDEIAALDAEREALGALRALVPLQRGAAQSRLEAVDRELSLLSERLSAAELRDAGQRLGDVRNAAAKLAAGEPRLRDTEAEILRLAAGLWGENGLVAEGNRISVLSGKWSDHLLRIQQMSASIKRRYRAAGVLAPAGEWLQHPPADVPSREQLRVARLRAFRTMAVARRVMVGIEERRSSEPAFEAQVERVLAVKRGQPKPAEELAARARSLIQMRRKLEDDTLQAAQSLEERTTHFDKLTAQMLAERNDIATFVRKRVLWSPSVSGGSVFSPADLGQALAWLFTNPEWPAAMKEILTPGSAWLPWILAGLLVVILLRRRSVVRAGLREPMGADADSPVSASKRLIMATVRTAMLAAGPASLVYLLHGIFGLGESFALTRSISSALYSTCTLVFILSFLHEALAEHGMVRSVLAWNGELCRDLLRELSWLRIAIPPLAVVILTLQAEGSLVSDDFTLQAHNNSLGRLAFIAALLCVFVSCWRLLQPEGAVARAVRDRIEEARRGAWRLVTRPIVCGVIGLLILLSLAGFYLTALVISFSLCWTIVLTLGLGLISNLVLRWRRDERRALMSRGASSPVDAERAESQVRQISRFGVTVAWIVGTLVIWADVLPALSLLDHVRVYPSVALMKPAEERDSMEPAAPQAQAAPAAAPVPSPVPGLKPAADQKPAAPATPLYLSDILIAVFVGAVTVILIKDVPGLLEYMVLRRLRLDKGALYAISTITRYALTILGVGAVSGILGIQWSQVQWLAAALTFGIGFGLQEIFANFASGLILLLDRSIRVGDAVSVGELSGRVSNIQMRATTITLWDRSEMIVPNKEFITNKLVNWTLSYPETRVDVKVGVAYGSDLELVRKVLFEVAAANPHVLKEPPADVFLMAFADSSINFELRAFVMFETGKLKVADQLYRAVYDEFNKHGIVIAFPQLDVHVDTGPAGLPK